MNSSDEFNVHSGKAALISVIFALGVAGTSPLWPKFQGVNLAWFQALLFVSFAGVSVWTGWESRRSKIGAFSLSLSAVLLLIFVVNLVRFFIGFE